ncbi:MAG: homocysteine S-methyltransferase family protein [Candidatus Aegiribacteria sp.]|nr:homocysteine S-methyltransferase family protein [Candidatus Aegiribacteria sp.]
MNLLDTESVVLADGAIGEYLFSLGFPGSYLACEAVIRSPEILGSIHREYAFAGAKILTTDTFDANVLKLDMHGLADRCREINSKAAKLAARIPDCMVAGAVGPLNSGRSFSLGQSDPDHLREAFVPQIEGLLEGGAELILLETQVDPRQARLIYDIVRSMSLDIPIAVSFTFGQDILTPSGFSVNDTVDVFRDTDIVMLGANHGIGPLQFLDIHRRLKLISPFPILLEPNSGTGKYVDGRFIFPDNPEHFSRCMLSCTDSETALIGGCCGTTPAFISLLAERLRNKEKTSVTSEWISETGGEVPAVRASDTPPGLAGQLTRKDALIIELLPPRGGDFSTFLSRAEKLEQFAPVTISIPDSPMGRVRVSPCLAGLYLREELGIEPLVHFALRDRSLTRVQSDLLGLAGTGVQGLFLISGDPPSLGDYPEATAVYDLTTEETLELIQHLINGLDFNKRSIGAGAGFFPGTAISLGGESQLEKIKKRWDRGCRFFISQPVYSLETIEHSVKLMKEYPILPALMPLRNRISAEYLASEVPGISIPDHVMSKIGSLDDRDVLLYSVDLLSELMEHLRGISSGVYLAGSRKGSRMLAEAWRSQR